MTFITHLMKSYLMPFHTYQCLAFSNAFSFFLNRNCEAITYYPISAFAFMDLSLRLHDSFAEIEPMHLRWSHTGWSVCSFHFPNIRDYVKLFCVVLGAPSVQMPVASLFHLILQQLFGTLFLQSLPPLLIREISTVCRFFLLILLVKWFSCKAWGLSFSSLYSLHLVDVQNFVQEEAENNPECI